MAVDGISTHSTQSPYLPGAERVPKKALGQEDFFQLLAVQLSSQDPLKPMEDTDFIAQMSSFSSLEMMGNLTSEFGVFNAQQELVSAQNLLGRQVTISDGSDTEVVGMVSAVHSDENGETKITVNGADYRVSSVRRVEIPTSTTSSN